MRWRVALGLLAGMAPTAAFAEGSMPQMDFANPLTTSQVVWMAIILVALYLILSRWGLPEIGKVLENRAQTIGADLETARAAKAAADEAVAALNKTMNQARAEAQAQIAQAVAKAKATALAESQALAEKLAAQLQEAETQITAARTAALAAIRPVAAEAAAEMLARLTGKTPARETLAPQIDAAYAARAA